MDKSQAMAQLVRDSELKAIELVGSAFSMGIPSEFISPESVQFTMEYEFSASSSEKEDNEEPAEIFCFVGTHVKGTLKEKPPESQSNEVITGDFSFVVRYIYKGQGELNKELIDSLARSQAGFQAYPYIRAYLAFQLNQMGIPGFLLPLLKVGAARNKKSDQERAKNN